jgi:amino acid adenylation domain-containing protein
MMPSAFVVLDALPLTPSGKVDRQALPVPDRARPELEPTFVAPRTPVEELLVRIWTEVLGLEEVGVDDNFFDLGGHSLLATQVISRLREALDVELQLRSLFESPTIANLAEHVEAARSKPLNLASARILPLPCETVCPLSFPQQRLWFLSQLWPNSFAYNMTSGFRLTGPLNIEALEQALEEIVRRHEALRTMFSVRNGQPVQVIAEQWSMELPIIKLSDCPDADLNEEVYHLFQNEVRRPFDLSSDLMLRGNLLRLHEKEHVLFLTMHHIASDDWSLGVLYRELSVIYKAFSTGGLCPLPEPPIQYKHYAIWQRRVFQEAALEKHFSFWKQQLSDSLPVPYLASDYPRPPVQTFNGARQSLVLPKALANALKALSREAGATFFMTLLAALKMLLHRLTGKNDIAVGSPVAGRDRSETEGLIGLFLNTLVLRTNLSDNPTFRELLKWVREVALAAYEHQDLPFEKLLEKLQPRRDLSCTPLFQVFFNVYNFEDPNLELHGLTVRPLEITEPVSMFDLTLYVRERNDATHLELSYNTDLFESATISQILGYYRTLLEGLVQNPDRLISSYPLLTSEEHNRLSTQGNLWSPNNPFIEFKKEEIEQSISARFEQQVRLYPHKAAVKTKNHQWTYCELNQRANCIAQTILKSHVGAGGTIGLLLEHDAPMVAGILGVLKAGKVYVAVDPSYPRDRVAHILEDSQAGTIITSSRNIELAKNSTNGILPMINIDELDATISKADPKLPISPPSLAYILYTSGSTGKPKGVMQSHRNVLHFIRVYTNHLHISSDDRLTLFSSSGYDAAVVDIFAALLNGATLYPRNVKEEGPAGVTEWLLKEKITLYHSTPTLYQSLEDSFQSKTRFSSLRAIVLGGEEAFKKNVEQYREYFSQECLLVNLYGSTESSINLLYTVDTQTNVTREVLPIGYPVEDTEVLLLNERGEAEVYGEIGIRSEHIALGYWQNPEMTKVAFLADPEGGTKGIYRTGDRGRLLPDGSIAFVGRNDFQVKVRGFRVELEEIEVVLKRHPTVREAAVIARGDTRGDKYLAAYLLPKEEAAPTVTGLQRFAKQKLPDYMMPAAFVILKTLPITPNGKVDRGALPAPDQARPQLEEAYVAPRTHVEEMLASIWSEVLGVEQVGIYDDFFELGGHSLLATQVASRMFDTFRVELPLRTLFEKPTIHELAIAIAEIQAERVDGADMHRILADIESLPEQEAQRHLTDESK